MQDNQEECREAARVQLCKVDRYLCERRRAQAKRAKWFECRVVEEGAKQLASGRRDVAGPMRFSAPSLEPPGPLLSICGL